MQVQVAEDALTSFYNRRHPEYDGLLSHWVFCEQTYLGGRDWFGSNIFRYLKEGDKEFADRLFRAYRFNHTREAVDLVQKYLFKAAVQRNTEDAPDSLKKFWTKATRSGQGINELIRLVSTQNSLVGRVALVVDNSMQPSFDEDGTQRKMSVAEVEQSKGMIYAYVVMPRDILDYAWDKDDGELLWIKLREYVRNDADPLTDDGLTRERVRLWTRTDWQLFEQDIDDKEKNGNAKNTRLVERRAHDLGMVPVKLCDHMQSDHPFKSSGLVDDITYLDRAIANYLSNLDAIIQDQTFSQLAIPAQAMPGDKKSAREQMVEMGTKRIFTYDGGAGSTARPEFISPDPKQAGVILNVINKIINEIYSTIGLAGERTKQDNAVGIDNSSGVAKAYDFERVNSLLLSKAARLQEVENWIVDTVLLWAGDSAVPEPYVTYPTTFDVASLGDELVTAEALQKVAAPIEVRREHMKAVVLKLLPQVTDAAWKKLMAAVESWEDLAEKAVEATTEATKASAEATKSNAEVAKTVAAQKPAASGDKPVAAQSRQGSVTPGSKNTPKSAAK